MYEITEQNRTLAILGKFDLDSKMTFFIMTPISANRFFKPQLYDTFSRTYPLQSDNLFY